MANVPAAHASVVRVLPLRAVFVRVQVCLTKLSLKYNEQEMSLKKTNGVGLKNEENITQARLSTCT